MTTWTIKDQIMNVESLCEVYEVEFFVGQRRSGLQPSFRINMDVYNGYLFALELCKGGERHVWVARTVSNLSINLRRLKTI